MSQYHDLERRIRILERQNQYGVVTGLQLEPTAETATATTTMSDDFGGKHSTIIHQNYGFWSRPLPGSQHVVVNLGGTATKGHAISSNDERYRPTNLSPGDIFVGDNASQSIWLRNGMQIVITANGTVTINAAGGCTINGNTTINGTLSVSQTIVATSTITGSEVQTAGGIHLSTHHHTTTGGAGTSTSGPIG